jgi:transposase-like protein
MSAVEFVSAQAKIEVIQRAIDLGHHLLEAELHPRDQVLVAITFVVMLLEDTSMTTDRTFALEQATWACDRLVALRDHLRAEVQS